MTKQRQNSTIKTFLKFLPKMNFGFKLENLGYLPRWIVVFIDVNMILFAGFVTFISFKGLKLNYVNPNWLFLITFFGLLINVFFFWVFRTYSGIIRHSSYIDALKLFFSQVFTFTLFLIVNYIIYGFFGFKLFLTTGLIINGFLSFSFLMLYRMVVKQGYEHYNYLKNSDNLIKVLIFGSGANAIALANALKSESPKRYKVIGFVDYYGFNNTKTINNIPILNIKKSITNLLKTKNCQTLIFADKRLNKEERSSIIEECLEANFKVLTIPLIADVEGKRSISKSIKNFDIIDLLERKPIELDNNIISKQLQGKKILVTGAAGSIGSEIVRQVLKFSPKKVIVIDQAETPLHILSLEIGNEYPNVEIINIISDVRDRDSMEQVFHKHKPNVVYHAAAYKHVPLMEENPAQAVLTNVLGTKNIADLSLQYGVKRFVMVSTDKAVNPSNVMGASKRIAEKYVQSINNRLLAHQDLKQTKYITTRFGNVLGSNGSVVPLFKKQIQEGGPLTITHPDIIRYFMTIPEACQLVLEAGSMGKGGEIYIFDMGEPVKIVDLANKMIRLAGYVPGEDIEIKIIGLRPGEKLYEELLNDLSKTLPTHHEKIMISIENEIDYEVVNEMVNGLIDVAKSKSNSIIVSNMKKIVPEYKSLNSVFVQLDF